MFLVHVDIDTYEFDARFEHTLPHDLDRWANNLEGTVPHYHRCVCFRKIDMIIKTEKRPDKDDMEELKEMLQKATRCEHISLTLCEEIAC